MVRSPKSRSHNDSSSNRKQHQKRRRDSSGSDSDNDDAHDQRYRRRHEQPSREDDRARFKPPADVRVKQEPMTDDESRHRASANPRQHRSNEADSRPPPTHRRDQRTKQEKSYEWGKRTDEDDKSKAKEAPVEKEKPNFGLSGALLKDTNTYKGVVIKYSEPIEARKPKRRWRLYVFKGDQELPMYQIHRQSAYLIGRERGICDLPIDHPSCSKQHAVLQYRLVDYKRDDDSTGRRVLPYLIDLGSANGTFINNKRIDPERYYELRENDVIKFAFSTREYVLLHEESAGSLLKAGDDDDGFDVNIKQENDTK